MVVDIRWCFTHHEQQQRERSGWIDEATLPSRSCRQSRPNNELEHLMVVFFNWGSRHSMHSLREPFHIHQQLLLQQPIEFRSNIDSLGHHQFRQHRRAEIRTIIFRMLLHSFIELLLALLPPNPEVIKHPTNNM